MIYILKDHYKIIIKNIKKCQEAFAKINGKDVTENKNLTNSIYILINEKEEESLLKDLDKLELDDIFYYKEDDHEDSNEEDDCKDSNEEDDREDSENNNKYEIFY